MEKGMFKTIAILTSPYIFIIFILGFSSYTLVPFKKKNLRSF